jgi:hypothetical protein
MAVALIGKRKGAYAFTVKAEGLLRRQVTFPLLGNPLVGRRDA